MVALQSSRLTLRAARPEDATALFEGFSDPEVMRYWSEPPHPDTARTQAWLSTMTRSPQNGVTDFIICLRNDSAIIAEGMPIGKIGVYSPRPSNEIGFLLSRQHWHRGYAREALILILDYLFGFENKAAANDGQEISEDALANEKPSEHTMLSDVEQRSRWLYPCITADTDPRNVASIGLLKRLGFQESGYAKDTFEIDGTLVDSLYLKLSRSEWLVSWKNESSKFSS